MTLKELVIKSYNNSLKKGFWDKRRNIGEMLMLITSELSEALEEKSMIDSLPITRILFNSDGVNI